MRKEYENQPQRLTLEDVSRQAQAELLRDGQHAPILIAQGSQNFVVTQFSEMESSHEGRMEQMAVAGFAIADRGGIGQLEEIFFISEAWLSVGSEGRPPQIPPSQDPNRKEMLIISSLAMKDRLAKVKLYEMLRDAEGYLTRLQEYSSPHEADRTVESPLLTAFAEGFALGLGRRSD
jgi:hypothetical protein